MTDLQTLSINREDMTNGSFRKKKELVSTAQFSKTEAVVILVGGGLLSTKFSRFFQSAKISAEFSRFQSIKNAD